MNKKENILLILTDQQRWDILGCYGAPQCKTPNIDRLAARGVRFDNAFTLISPCAPSRSALFTGHYGHVTGVVSNDQPFDQSLPNFASELPKAGYQLGYSGKWHVDPERAPSEWGFTCKRDFPGYGYPANDANIRGMRCGPPADSQVSKNYLQYLESNGLEIPRLEKAFYGERNPRQRHRELHGLQSGSIDQNFESIVAEETVQLLKDFEGTDDPFFIWSNFWGPHSPCIVPEPYYSMYDPASIPEEPSFRDTLERRPYVQKLISRYWGIDPDNWGEWQQLIARYWGYMTMIDDLVGKIFDELDRQGLWDNTLVVFSTDHGDNMGAHKLFEKGPFFDDECFRIPFVAASPNCKNPGSVCDEFVYLQDLFPSVLEKAGLPVPEVPDTQSILPQLEGEQQPVGRDSVYCQFNAQIFEHKARMVRTRDYKFVFNLSDVGELYDLVEDPHEMNNLFGEEAYEEIQETLMQKMQEHMERVGDPLLEQLMQLRCIYR